MKSEKEIKEEMEKCEKRMEQVRDGKNIDELSISQLIDWFEVKAEHQALYWVLMS
jgi:hypothetical protein